jgi:hypothetical protein
MGTMTNQKLIINIISRNKKRVYKIPSYKGEIIINDFREWFYIPLKDWSITDYIKQWQEGIERIKTENTSALISCLLQSERKYLYWWTLYRENNTVLIHNEMYGTSSFLKEIGKKPITTTNFYQFVPPYQRFTSSGHKASEWKVTLPEI